MRKFLQHPLMRILAGAVFVVEVMSGVQSAVRLLPGQDTRAVPLISVLLIAGAALAAYAGFARWYERRALTELAVATAPRELAGGLLIGAALFSTTIAIIWALGSYSVAGVNDVAKLLPAAEFALVGAIVEELLFRGLLFRLLEEWLGSWIALAASACVFGAVHLANPHATLWAGLSIAIQAGVLLGTAYMQFRRLWLPIGLHIAWNFTQGGIFGGAVSGHAADGLLRGTLTGPTWVTGGPFGVEASVFATAVCVVMAGYFLWRSRRAAAFLAPRWRRAIPA